MQQSSTEQQYRIYLAGASTTDEIARVQRWSKRLTDAGLCVVSTWPGLVTAVGAGNPRDASNEQRRIWSTRDLNELTTANALWLLCAPAEIATRGVWVELGVAYARAHLIVSSGDTKQSIFTALGVEYETDEDAFKGLLLVAGAAARSAP